MAYDEAMAERIRILLREEEGVTEMKMFGGLAFLVNGNMAVAAGGGGAMMVRADPEASDHLTIRDGVALMEMGGRAMKGWLSVSPDAVAGDSALGEWVDRGVDYARSLPAKDPTAPKKKMGARRPAAKK